MVNRSAPTAGHGLVSHTRREANLPGAEYRTGVKRSSSLLSTHSLHLLTQQLGLRSRWRQLSLSHQLPVASCLSASPFFSLLLLNTLSLPSCTTWLSVPSLKNHKALSPPPPSAELPKSAFQRISPLYESSCSSLRCCSA